MMRGENRKEVIPESAVLDTPPIGPSFDPANVLLFGEIWSPGNTWSEQQRKFDSCAHAGIPHFWSVAQDRRGPVELVAYRLEDGHYVSETTTKLGDGPLTVTTGPVSVELDIAALRL